MAYDNDTRDAGRDEPAKGNSTGQQSKRRARLDDKFDLGEARVLLTGSQAIVRLALMQHERDKRAGLDTAGYVTGYRGSPVAGIEGAFLRTKKALTDRNIVFHPGLNEDLAATALWGTQQAEMRGEGKYDGVFGIWYGKGPGVDRTGDVFRHANHAGTSKHGGVLALMGDDHTCESSTSAHQSEFAFVDAMIPVLNPAGVQEMLDYGLHGIALSRFAGVWVGLKCVKDNVESTATVDGRIDRVEIKLPTDFVMPEGGLNIRVVDSALAKEARLHDFKRDAILAYNRANSLDKIVMRGGPNPKIGIITTGKSYLDVRQALDELGIDEVKAANIGLRLYKVAMPYPMDPVGLEDFVEGLDLVIVVEEKRSLIEVQVREELYNHSHQPKVVGKKDESGRNWLFPAKGALEATDIAIAIGERLLKYADDQGIKTALGDLMRMRGNRPEAVEAATRIPYFCPGCPHNSSTVVPKGAHAYAGIGCHYMAQWMDRQTDGFTQMGGEGANWIGEAHFSKRDHVFQNLGDGTYAHSGSLAVRASIVAGVNITYKILYNDAVAMTGGQHLDSGITVGSIAAQMKAEGAKKVVVVTDEPNKYPSNFLPAGTPVFHRRDLQDIQQQLAKEEGVTVLIYDQTCAAEKRRRRKRGLFPDPDKRVFINPAVCEGCGDCGKKSNCVAVIPLETEFGRKRAIDQSACNKDFSCTNGFCPSFVTVHGAKIRKPEKDERVHDALEAAFAKLPEPRLPQLGATPYTILVTGVGGTGVVTISQVLGQAAFLEGKGFGGIDMTGLAQKGGAVACHMRIAKDQDQIHAIRAGVGGSDLILGCDLMVTGSNKVLETVKPGKTHIVYSTYEMVSGEFTRKPDASVPGLALRRSIDERAGTLKPSALDAHTYAERLYGDSIASNMFLLGYAYQQGLVPIGAAAIEEAVALNGAAVAMNVSAFRAGRLAVADRAALDALARPAQQAEPNAPMPLEEFVDRRAAILTQYQDKALAEHYRERIAAIQALEEHRMPSRTSLTRSVASAYFKLLAYKDEYEVARLHADPAFAEQLRQNFDGKLKLEFHLAPPLLARRDKVTGEPRKMSFGAWMLPVFRILAKGKRLRGTAFDVFGYTEERRKERQMIADYEAVLDEIAERLTPATYATTVALASLPETIKGYGHIKLANYELAKKREQQLLAQLRAPASERQAAAE